MLRSTARYLRKFVAGFVATLTVSTCAAQQPVLFDHLNMDKGLSQNTVISIAQDKQGFIWMGTRYGLNRYDGHRFKVYQTKASDPNALKDNYVMALLCDDKGLMWVGTEAGVHRYDPVSDRFIQIADKKEFVKKGSGTITHILQDQSSKLWVGTEYGLKLLDKDSNRFTQNYLTINSKLPSDNIRCTYHDVNGNLWIGTANGLSKAVFRNNKLHITASYSKSISNGLSDNFITSITEDKSHNLWIATQSGGLNLYRPVTDDFISFRHNENPSSIISNVIRKILTDDFGRLWIGTLDGLSIMDTKTRVFSAYRYDAENKKSLSQNSVYSIFKDKNGSMWVGTYYAGANVSYPYTTRFKTYYKNEYRSSLNNNVVSSILADQNHNLWIGTEGGGLNFYNQKSGTYEAFTSDVANPGKLASNLIKCLFIDSRHQLWIGTHGGGLNLFDQHTRQFKRYLFDPAVPKYLLDEINSITEDSGRLWIGTQKNGLLISDSAKTSFKLYSQKAKINSITAVFHKQDDIWIGTSYGLYILNKRSDSLIPFQNITTDHKSLKGLEINCIYQTKDGKIWIGTYYGGLVCYDPVQKTSKTFTREDGLPNNNVFGVLEDEQQNIWISTGNGLSVFNRQNKLFKNYNIADGLIANEFNKNAYFKNSDGEMFFGGYNGFVSFYPDKIQTNTERSEIVLTDLKFQNKVVNSNADDGILQKNINALEEIRFDYDQNTFSIDFALLNFIKPEKNRYAYRLDGYEKSWNEVAVPTVTYINLPPGTYTLLIKGTNNDGFTSKNIRSLKIIVSPPFYRTWWAYLFYTALAVVIIVIVARYILIQALLKKEKEVSENKLEFFTNISHEIRTPLTLIVGPLENLIDETNENPSINRSLLPIKKNADRLMNLVTELLDFRKAESGKLSLKVSLTEMNQFSEEIFLAFQNVAISKNADYSFRQLTAPVMVYFDKIQLEKVLFNLLSNSLKFCPHKGKVTVDLSEDHENVYINVSNNGRGIPPENQANLFTSFYQANPGTNIGTGLGLSLSKSIIELHHGSISFQSTFNEDGISGFTTFSVQLKKGKKHFSAKEITGETDIEKFVLKPGSEAIEVPEANSPAGERYTLLLVEDNAEIRSFIKNALGSQFNIIEEADGSAGWENAIANIPDIIISDVMMPHMDGLELCRRLKTDERTSHIPVILLTARSAYIHQINGLETGADAYIVKPFNLRILQLNIRNLLTTRETLKKRFSNTPDFDAKEFAANPVEQAFLNKTIRVIEENISEPDFVVSVLASEVGMSKPVLYKKIRSLTGLSVNDFVKSIRLKKAARLLLEKHGNVSEIAYQVGFSDRKYFSLEFKKMFGVNPTDYINSKKNIN